MERKFYIIKKKNMESIDVYSVKNSKDVKNDDAIIKEFPSCYFLYRTYGNRYFKSLEELKDSLMKGIKNYRISLTEVELTLSGLRNDKLASTSVDHAGQAE